MVRLAAMVESKRCASERIVSFDESAPDAANARSCSSGPSPVNANASRVANASSSTTPPSADSTRKRNAGDCSSTWVINRALDSSDSESRSLRQVSPSLASSSARAGLRKSAVASFSTNRGAHASEMGQGERAATFIDVVVRSEASSSFSASETDAACASATVEKPSPSSSGISSVASTFKACFTECCHSRRVRRRSRCGAALLVQVTSTGFIGPGSRLGAAGWRQASSIITTAARRHRTRRTSNATLQQAQAVVPAGAWRRRKTARPRRR